MPNDTPTAEESIQALIDSKSVTHRLSISELADAQETACLRTVCEFIAGTIYRVGPYDYLIQIDNAEDELDQVLVEQLAQRFDTAQVQLDEVSPTPQAPAEPIVQSLDKALKSGALSFASSENSDSASAVIAVEFAGHLAQSAAEKMARISFDVQENTILPRLEAMEGRFDVLEAIIKDAVQTDFSDKLEQVNKALASHADRMDGNLTQDRLDTLIALMTPTNTDADAAEISNQRLATAIETLLQTMQETAQPVPALMDPYFYQLNRQSEELINALKESTVAHADVAHLKTQIEAFQTMAQSAPIQGALSASEKMDALEEISSGLSSLMSRTFALTQLGAKNLDTAELDTDEQDIDVTPPQDDADTIENPPDAELSQVVNVDEGAEPQEAPLDIEANDDETGIKLTFEPAEVTSAPQESETTSATAPTEEELDQRVEELLRSPRHSENEDDLQRQTG